MLYLASTSPRRRQLLQQAGLAYRCVPPGDEPEGHGAPIERALQRATAKAGGARADGEPGLVLGVDTVVELDGEEFGKARDRGHAAEMLRRLSGRVHQVHSACCLRPQPDDGRRWQRAVTAEVLFEELDDAALERYLLSGDWQGKAGAYGIQDDTAGFVRLLSGDRDTVIGMSLALLRELIAEAGGEGVA